MASRFLRASTLAGVLAACSGNAGNSGYSASSTEIANGGAENFQTPPPAQSLAGAGGRGSTKPSPSGGSATGEHDEGGSAQAEFSDAGMGGAAGEAATPPPCDLNGNCSSNGDGAKATCGVLPGNECEFAGFVGATAQVGWGASAVIGLACCGLCECVPVEVYFDGAQCWQGFPQCADHGFSMPHATTEPNPSFRPSTDAHGTFYLGSGGFGGSNAIGAGTGGSDAIGGGTGGSDAIGGGIGGGGTTAGGVDGGDPTAGGVGGGNPTAGGAGRSASSAAGTADG